MPAFFLLAIFFACYLVAPSNAQTRIGVAVDAETRVVRSGVGGTQVVAKLTPVYANDRLQANSNGLAQIKFIDDTKIVVGPNSAVTLDDFIFSTSRTATEVSVSVTKGAFRWISGRSGSKAYSIKTPAGSIGVRGTAFDVTILGGTTNVLLLQGQVTVCPRSGGCMSVRNRCDYVAFNRGGIIEKSNLLKKTNIRRYQRTFPILVEQQQLNRQFRREVAGCKAADTESDAQPIGFTPADNPAPPDVPDDPDPPDGRQRGNPGNDKDRGWAGPNPNGKDFGAPGRGRSNRDEARAGPDRGRHQVASKAQGSSSSSSGKSGGKGDGGKGNGNGNGNGNGGGKGNGNGNGNGNGGGKGNGNR